MGNVIRQLRKRFNDRDLVKLIMLLTFAAISVALINYFTIKVLSSVRAYINGESQYSKGEKDASQNLIFLLETQDKSYWNVFLASLAIPQGDSLAREMLMNDGDPEMVRQGFLKGRNNQDDIDDMIWLFQTFKSRPLMNVPIQIWKKGDSLVYQKYLIGLRVMDFVERGISNETVKKKLMEEISTNSNELMLLESSFSENLGMTSRQIIKFLISFNFIYITCLFLMAMYYVSRTMRKLNQRNVELSNTNSELDKFVYSASHDLRAPISSLKGLVSISKFESDPVKIKSYLDLMNQTLDKQDQFIKDIIDYSLNKKNELNLVPVNLAVMIDEAVSEHLYMPGASEVKITKELTASEIQSDPKRFSIVVNNLISNAFKYQDVSKSEKTLTITSKITDRNAFIEIEDNGIGIHPKHHAHIFEMFYVVTAGSKGSGLGLYITKETINKLGGDIFVSSKINFGTKFTIRLPQPT